MIVDPAALLCCLMEFFTDRIDLWARDMRNFESVQMNGLLLVMDVVSSLQLASISMAMFRPINRLNNATRIATILVLLYLNTRFNQEGNHQVINVPRNKRSETQLCTSRKQTRDAGRLGWYHTILYDYHHYYYYTVVVYSIYY